MGRGMAEGRGKERVEKGEDIWLSSFEARLVPISPSFSPSFSSFVPPSSSSVTSGPVKLIIYFPRLRGPRKWILSPLPQTSVSRTNWIWGKLYESHQLVSRRRLMEKWDSFGGEREREGIWFYTREKRRSRRLIVNCLARELFVRSFDRSNNSISILFFFQRSIVGDCPIDGFGSRASGFIRPCKNDYPRGMKRGVSTSTGPVPRGIGPELQKHRSNF